MHVDGDIGLFWSNNSQKNRRVSGFSKKTLEYVQLE